MSGSYLKAAVCAAIVVPLGLPLGAQAQEAPVTLGPDLSQYTDTNQTDCAADPFNSPELAAPSCTWSSAGPDAQVVPGSGTISQVSVKVGATTGAMKVVIMRVELELQEAAGQAPSSRTICCTEVAESAEFTPTPDSIATVPVDLPVALGFNGQTHSLSLDLVGLSVLEDGVPVPAATGVQEKAGGPEAGEEEGGPPEAEAEVQPTTFVERPAMQQNGQIQTAEEGKGDLVLMDVVWDPAPGTRVARPTPVPGTSPEAEPAMGPGAGITSALDAPALAFAKNTPARIRGRRALVPLTCEAATACKGVVELQSSAVSAGAARATGAATVGRDPAGHRTHAKRPAETYAKGSFDIPAHHSRTVTLKLSGAGRRLVRERRRIGLWINVTLTGATPARLYSRAARLTF